MLLATVKAPVIKSAGLAKAMPDMTIHQRTYQIGKLVDGGMLVPIEKGARQYTIGFMGNLLLRGVVHALTVEGFVTDELNAPGGSAAEKPAATSAQ